MAVIRLDLAYDGTDFRGFAKQPRARTVQGTLEQALHSILGAGPRVSVAGRTDAGVHAEGQVVSFQAETDPSRLQRSLNSMLAPEIVVRRARRAPAGFDARHSATGREYRYRIRTAEVPDPFTARYEWHRPGRYAMAAMRKAARLLEGEHDFASFGRSRKDGASTRRHLRRLALRRNGDLLDVLAVADSFLHQMVRSLVGTLVAVGDGRLEPEGMPGILEARSRQAAGPVAPPDGLVLVAVRYGTIPRTRTRSRLAGEK
ncbi:MAG TPA: tRNA pseudouridine(38-40) synthase TruA [Actinomycetota bacterium]|nr:tRNA pseudouridine(38-40) synthase TruA [Actinomycetota bacterium]